MWSMIDIEVYAGLLLGYGLLLIGLATLKVR